MSITNCALWENGRPVGLPGLRRAPVERSFLYRPQQDWTYSHHQHLTFFLGRYHAIWSNSRQDEDAPGQRVLWSSSTDLQHWAEPRPLVDSVRDDHGVERVLTAAGFHQYGGRLVAYLGNYGPGKETTRLEALTTTDGSTWGERRAVGVPVNPNHGPQLTSSGRLIVCGNISFPFTDDPAGLTGWQMTGLYPPAEAATIKDDPESFWGVAERQGWPTALCEGSFYETGDRVLHMLLRTTGRPYEEYRLGLTESRDDGRTWSPPRRTEFSDTDAKFHFGRLPDGRFYYVGNPIGAGRTPLVLSLSEDGARFDRHFLLADEPYTPRREGRWKGGYGYPHTLIHGGRLCVIVSRQKEAVEVIGVPLEAL